MSIVIGTVERKKEFTELFNKYVELEKKKKTLSADTSTIIGDFKNRMTEGMDKFQKKTKKAAIDKYIRSKIEVDEGKDPVEDTLPVRADHLDFSSDTIELLDSIIEDKRSATFQSKVMSSEQNDLMEDIIKFFGTTEEIAKGAVKELVAMSLGKYHIMDKIASHVAEGEAILFGKENE